MFSFFRGDNRIVQAGLPDPTEEIFRRFTGNKPLLVLLWNGFFSTFPYYKLFLVMSFIFQGFGKGTDGSAVERRLKKGRIHLFLGVLERWRQSIDYPVVFM
jgi:hypothetical protein